MAADIRAESSSGQRPMEAVVVNSIIYSKPSFCSIAVNLGDIPIINDNKPATSSKLKTGNSPNNNLFQSEMDLNSSCWTNLSVPPPPAGAKVYKMCTTINGTIHHQISDFCDNIIAMAGLFDVVKNDVSKDDDEDSFIEFDYGDNDNLGVANNLDTDDDEDDCESNGDEDDCGNNNLDDDDDDNDVVDFAFECPIEPAPKFNCDRKKKVRFNTKPTVHYMITWNYAYRAARKGEWEMYARDCERFKMRVQRAALLLNTILDKKHRQKIYEERFVHLYDNDVENALEQQTKPPDNQQTNVAAEEEHAEKTVEHKETPTNESKKPHQKKKRKKKRFCKMGNKHYF